MQKIKITVSTIQDQFLCLHRFFHVSHLKAAVVAMPAKTIVPLEDNFILQTTDDDGNDDDDNNDNDDDDSKISFCGLLLSSVQGTEDIEVIPFFCFLMRLHDQ